MRGFVRAFSCLFVFFPLLLLPPSASAQERRLVVTEGADYFGADYDVRKEVDLEACQAACRDDAECKAFTYNTAARWCFLKSEVGELRAVEGAISGRIVAASEPTVNVEAERISELKFLPQNFIDEARRFVGRLSDTQGSGASLDSAVADAEAAVAANSYLRALDLYGEALRLAPERFDLWVAYTDAAIRASSDDWQVQQQLGENRTAGAVNAYLRAVTPEERARALAQLGWALADRYEWKPSIRAYRASLALAEDESNRALYERVLAEHGFRIVGHDVEADAAAPRICINFSDQLAEGRNLSDYVSVEGGQNLAVEAGGQQICIDGVEHGSRYQVTVREGLPAADGESLASSAALDIFVRDRAPSVRFLGSAYVLPAGGEPTIPAVTVNTKRIDATLYRIGDRQLAEAIADGTFLSQLSSWETDTIETRSGEKVWEGSVDVASEINREMTTAIPVGELSAELQPGAYVLTARAMNDTSDDWEARATQWFVVTDLGLTTLAGNDGLNVVVRSLGSAEPVADVELRLIAVSNEVLTATATDADGFARFPAGLMRGTGGMAPGLLVAFTAAGDYSFLDLSKSPMDLTDRGVEGREPPKPLDIFLTTERGIYRAGETVYATTLVRDAKTEAMMNLPLTAIVTRPDGKESTRVGIQDQGLGGTVTPFELAADAMRGTWRIAVHADVKAAALAETTFLVEDFEPERLDFDIETSAEALDPSQPAELSVDARFLYGAPAANLNVEGEAVVSAARNLSAYPGFVFGLADEAFNATTEPLAGATTDETGHAAIAVKLPASLVSSRPLEAKVNVRVLDSSARPVERNVTLPIVGASGRLGIKPLFEGAAGENAPVAFELIAVDPAGARTSTAGVRWSLYQLRTDFQWYRSDGRWNYERIETKTRVANGTADISADGPAWVEAAVEWGSYRLEVEAADGALPASFDFEAGWYVEAKALDTPEALKVSLDKELYAPGENARVHIETRFDGVALVMVLDDRLIATQAVEVSGNMAEVDIPVTRDWGPGAYVTAVLYRPMDIAEKRMPARALGLAWAGVDPAERDLDVAIEAPGEMRPRQDVPVTLTLAGLPAGTEAYVTLAAVDLGILNLTRYETPDPEEYYFGRRRLGVAIRDLYNQLIDRMQGVRGVVRSGGDVGLAGFEGEAPTETLVAFHSGVLEVGPDGTASLAVPIPDFNGTVRLMAMAWTATGVGHAEKDVLVRDPMVVTASLPRFLAPGDRSRLSLDLTSVEDIAGTVSLSVSAETGAVAVETTSALSVELQPNQRKQVLVPISGETVGADILNVALTLPDGTVLEKAIGIDVRLNEPPVATTEFITVRPGGDLTITPDRLEGLVPGTASIQVSASGAGRLNVPAILRALDRYPYGCTEQLTSRAMPLVYLNDVAVQAGLATDPEIRERVEKAIAGVLGNQSASGSFGLWAPDGGDDLWLDAYVTDFLTRANQNGFRVPAEALELAVDNLKNRLAYAGDFESGGEDIAYVLYVLAANGRAAIGDLRYYAEAKLDAFTTPLAKAQIGAALALYGDRLRADAVFRAALADLDAREVARRDDYGSGLRDGAAILTLASESRAEIDLVSLATRVAEDRLAARYTSTQEDAWSLLAAHALMQSVSQPRLSVNGEPVNGPLFRSLEAENLAAQPIVIANSGDRPVEVGMTVRGVPATPEPAGGNFYELARSYYTLDGEAADLTAVEQGARLVVVLDVTTSETEGARLVLDDPLPAGFEIDNPHILSSGDVAALDWLDLSVSPAHVEFRADRFIAAWDLEPGGATAFQFAYIVRATSPGAFLHPAALVEDMYRPERRARTDSGKVEVVGPLR
ncbi:MAG: MG2 domain-containing protein [Propylenella sp.]